MKVRGPLVRYQPGRERTFLSGCSIAHQGSNCASPSRPLSIDTVLSRRSVRRHNVIAAPAAIGVRTDEIASLLP
ncbi:hypothetical protein B0G76_3143 [Paraburkholderia sp. BL23I1N1]|nr:hypothetical protein A8H39_32195 [Paraburkholderia fungorum]PZR45888.1 MAG: hypothetical protein DI523_19420 [Paraburkholderia fungorum]QLD52033.1 hypothetical protein C9419_24105 [Paraburkholderia fungorum]RKE36924.1 hypothetical protein B0G76_3143 [Paraburkholderia sp. BL23I1N1]